LKAAKEAVVNTAPKRLENKMSIIKVLNTKHETRNKSEIKNAKQGSGVALSNFEFSISNFKRQEGVQ